MENNAKVKYKHQIILRGSDVDIGYGPGVLVEAERRLSAQTGRLIELNSPSILFAKTDCDMMFLMDHVEVKLVKVEGETYV